MIHFASVSNFNRVAFFDKMSQQMLQMQTRKEHEDEKIQQLADNIQNQPKSSEQLLDVVR